MKKIDIDRIGGPLSAYQLAEFKLDTSPEFDGRIGNILLDLEDELPKRFGPRDPSSSFNGLAYYFDDANVLMMEYPEFKMLRNAFHGLRCSAELQVNENFATQVLGELSPGG